MGNILHEYIKNYDDFLFTIKLLTSNTSKLLRKTFEDASIINYSNETLLKYLFKQRNKEIKKINKYSDVLNVEINNYQIEIIEEDLNNLLHFIKNEHFEDN